jgi:hypothetical protein
MLYAQKSWIQFIGIGRSGHRMHLSERNTLLIPLLLSALCALLLSVVVPAADAAGHALVAPGSVALIGDLDSPQGEGAEPDPEQPLLLSGMQTVQRLPASRAVSHLGCARSPIILLPPARASPRHA